MYFGRNILDTFIPIVLSGYYGTVSVFQGFLFVTCIVSLNAEAEFISGITWKLENFPYGQAFKKAWEYEYRVRRQIWLDLGEEYRK